MSHTSKRPPVKYAAADLPTDLPEGTVAYDTTNQKMVAFKQGAWGDLGGAAGIGSTTYVRDNVAGVIDQIQGDIPFQWKRLDTSLKGLVIGTSCTSIGNVAFDNCIGLTGSLVIPNSITSIGNAAFRFCSGLTGSLVIPDSVTTIGLYAFQNCSGFNGSLVIPDSVTSIGDYAFDICSGLTGDLVIPNSFTSIGNAAFRFCSGLTGSLVIPDSVTSIGFYAFKDCSGLTGDLVIPDSVTSIGGSTFEGCSGLTNVDCHVEESVLDASNSLLGTSVTTIHVRASDLTWTAGAGQTIGGKTGITVIKDL